MNPFFKFPMFPTVRPALEGRLKDKMGYHDDVFIEIGHDGLWSREGT